MISTGHARAYVNHGRWLADCPVAECRNAVLLTAGATSMHCVDCLTVSVVDWPADADSLWEALQDRPVPATRNWFPPEHDLAVRSGSPHGQTVEDLRAETAERMSH